MPNPLEVAKDFLEKNFPHMNGAVITTAPHDQSIDAHVMNLLPDVNESHLDKEPSDVVTASKNFITEDGATLPKFLKMQVKNEQVVSVLESH